MHALWSMFGFYVLGCGVCAPQVKVITLTCSLHLGFDEHEVSTGVCVLDGFPVLVFGMFEINRSASSLFFYSC